MAISFSSILTPEGSSLSSASSYSTASISPSADTLVLCIVSVRSNTGAWASSPTLTGGGMSSWTLETTVSAFNDRLLFAFRSTDSSPGSGALTFTAPSGETMSAISVQAAEATGAATTGTNAADAIVQTETGNADTGVTSNPTLTYSSGFGAGNGAFSAFAVYGLSRSATPRSGWTELGDRADGANGGSLETQWRADSDTAADATYSDTSGVKTFLAYEIAAAATTTTLTADPGSASITGTAAAFAVTTILTAAAGACNITGVDADLTYYTDYAAEVVQDAPVAYWRLGEASGSTAVDEIGDNDGTYNAVTLGTTGLIPSSPNTAVTFGGSNNFVDLGTVGASDPLALAGQTITIEAWVKQDAGGDAEQRIVDKSTNINGANGYALDLDPATGSITVRVNSSFAGLGTLLSTGTRYHIVVVIRSDGSAESYVNGSSYGTASAGTLNAIPSASAGMKIGRLAYFNGRNFDGVLDEIAIYDYELSAARVLAHYNAAVTTDSLTASSGAYTITGTDATFSVSATLAADPGSVAISGTDISTTLTRFSDAGSVTITGTDAGLFTTAPLLADPGSVTVNGTNATLLRDRVLNAESGSVVLGLSDANLTLGTSIFAETSPVTVSGTAASLLVSSVLDAEAGSATISGTDAGLSYTFVLDADPGSVAISGTDATFTLDIPDQPTIPMSINREYERGKVRSDRGLIQDKANWGTDPTHPDFADGAEVNNGTVSAVAAFQRADSYAQPYQLPIIPAPGSYRIDSDLTLTSPLYLFAGREIIVTSGNTLTMNGVVWLGDTSARIFTGSGTATIAGDSIVPA